MQIKTSLDILNSLTLEFFAFKCRCILLEKDGIVSGSYSVLSFFRTVM